MGSDIKTHNSQALWIKKLSKEYEALKEQEWSEITLEDLKHALKNLVNGNRQEKTKYITSGSMPFMKLTAD